MVIVGCSYLWFLGATNVIWWLDPEFLHYAGSSVYLSGMRLLGLGALWIVGMIPVAALVISTFPRDSNRSVIGVGRVVYLAGVMVGVSLAISVALMLLSVPVSWLSPDLGNQVLKYATPMR